jgi:hypothetical protein
VPAAAAKTSKRCRRVVIKSFPKSFFSFALPCRLHPLVSGGRFSAKSHLRLEIKYVTEKRLSSILSMIFIFIAHETHILFKKRRIVHIKVT